MRKCSVAISLLAVALVLSNGWWAYRVLDAGVTRTYQSASLEEAQQALAQALAVIKANAGPDPTREQVISAAQAAWPAVEPFEKDGYCALAALAFDSTRQGGSSRRLLVLSNVDAQPFIAADRRQLRWLVR
jgi:hypothetical protein